MSRLNVDKITGKTGTNSGAPITLSGDTATLGSGVTVNGATITNTVGGVPLISVGSSSATGSDREISSIPTTANEIHVINDGVSSSNGSDSYLYLYMGHSGTTYDSSLKIRAAYVVVNHNSTETYGNSTQTYNQNYMILGSGLDSSRFYYGHLILTKISSTRYTVTGSGHRHNNNGTYPAVISYGGIVEVPSAITALKYSYNVSGSGFDAGTSYVFYR